MSWTSFLQDYTAVLAFSLFLLPPGYLFAHWTNLLGFRECSSSEKVLWSLCCSVPLAIEICVGIGRYAAPFTILCCFVVLALMAVFVLARTSSVPNGRTLDAKDRRATLLVLGFCFGLALLYPVVTADIASGRHLYVSTVIYDWSVRVPMVDAAIRSGVPPTNGLSALDGHAASLRYFYFWNVLCARVCTLVHVPGRSGLVASSVWAGWALLAAIFLSLKYLLGLRHRLRSQCALAFLPLSIIGLDLLPTLRLLFSDKLHPYVEMEWWRWDRTPSILSTPMYSPHHIAAFACILIALTSIALTLQDEGTAGRTKSNSSLAWIALFAGICFGAAAGISVFPTFVAVLICTVWVLWLLHKRQFATVAVLAASACVAVSLSFSFLHELTTTPGAASGSFVSLSWRNLSFVSNYLQQHYGLSRKPWPLQVTLTEGAVLMLHFFELGFFLFVLIHRIRHDWSRKLNVREQAMWVFFAGTALAYFFISSASIASPNDLGFDAGQFLRLLLQMWAVPWIYDLWRRWKAREPLGQASLSRRAGFALAACFLILGFVGELFQVLDERLYIPLVGSQVVRKQIDVFTTDQLSKRLYDIREAYRKMDQLPDSFRGAVSVQYNPLSPMQPALSYFSTHQIAAFDRGCGTGYGGDYPACQALMPRLAELYGNTAEGAIDAPAGNRRQDGLAASVATAKDAQAMCRELHLGALIAESLDSIWSKPDSWVWTMQPAFANQTVRVFRCPVS